jgi:hypothetical protein
MKTATVPQLAIVKAMTSIPKSHQRAPFIRICAETGPMMQIVNALKEPKNAMTAENSGIAIETATAAAAVADRLTTRTKNAFGISITPECALSIPR